MKKLVSLLVIIAMMLTAVLVVIPVSAADDPEGDVISGSKDILKMKANGTYYLEEDIEISSGFGSEFTGTFDGNGYTITITGGGPLFKSIKGATVKNVTVAGNDVKKTSSVQFGGIAETITDGILENVVSERNITYQSFQDFVSYAGGIAAQVGGTTTFTNVENKGEIMISTTGTYNDDGRPKAYEKPEVGGLIGKTMGGANISLINCKNSADIMSTQTQVNIGGFIGFVENASVFLSDCENTGDLMGMSDGTGGFVGLGGMIGRTNNKANVEHTIILSGCKNTGNISDAAGTKANMLAGGMIGRLYSVPHLTVNSCINEGDISVSGSGKGVWSGVGGIIGGYITFGHKWDSLAQSESRISNCLNAGDVHGGRPGGIIGGTFIQVTCKNMTLDVEYCINTGDITGLGADDGTFAGGIISGAPYGPDAENGAKLVHLNIKNCKNEGSVSNAEYAGGIVGAFVGETDFEPSLKIENCANAGAISGANGAGIIAASTQPITISGCLNKGTVEATTAGGIAASATSVQASNNFYLTGGAAGNHGTAAADIDAKIAAIAFQKAYNDMDITIDIKKAEALFEKDYSADSWATFKNAFDAAKAAVANFNNTQDNIDAAEEALEEAMADLVRKAPDLTALNAKLTEAKSKNRGDYNTTTFSYLTDAISAAEKDMVRDDVLQSEIDAHVVAIDEAIKGLKDRGPVTTLPTQSGLDDLFGDLYGTDGVTEAPTAAPTNPPTSTVAPTEPVEEEGGCGGVIGGAAVALVAIAAIGAGVVLKKKED